MRLYRLFLIAVILLLVPFCAAAKPQKIEYKFHKGEINRYKMIVSAGAKSQSGSMPNLFKMVAVIRQKTLSVNPDGSAKVESSFESAKYGVGGNEQKIDPSAFPAMVTLISKDGTTKMLTDQKGNPFGNNPFSGGMLSGYALPRKSISPGYRWSQPLPKPLSGKVACKLASDKVKIGDYTTAKIVGDISGKIDLSQLRAGVPSPAGNKPLPLSGSYTQYISPSIGKMIRTEGVFTTSVSMPAPPSNGKSSAKPTKTDMIFKMEMFLVK